jgi:hypothetical protein
LLSAATWLAKAAGEVEDDGLGAVVAAPDVAVAGVLAAAADPVWESTGAVGAAEEASVGAATLDVTTAMGVCTWDSTGTIGWKTIQGDSGVSVFGLPAKADPNENNSAPETRPNILMDFIYFLHDPCLALF